MGGREGTAGTVIGQREHRNTEARDMKTQGTVASICRGRWQEVMGASATGDTEARGMETQGLYEDTRDSSRRTRGTGT